MTLGTRGKTAVHVGDPLAAVMLVSDLAALLGVGATQAWHMEKAGEFAHLEILPRVGNRARYSGKKVQAWIDGEGHESPDSGRTTRDRFLAAGRRASAK